MRVSVQLDDFDLLEEAVDSECEGVRFGPEFCELKIPSLEVLEKAYELVHEGGKVFTYVTPRLSNSGVERIREQLALLNALGEVRVVVNDLGALNVVKRHPNLRPHLGRQLAFVPARCPWSDEIIEAGGLLARRWVRKVFSSTSLNHGLTLELYREHGVEGADVDWIPRVFPQFGFLSKRGLDLSIFLHLVPVIVSRRCHTARYLGERSHEACSRQCRRRVFLLESDMLGVELFLHGNTVFSRTQPSPKDVNKLKTVSELVLTMNPITGLESRKKINDYILGSTIGRALVSKQ